MDTTAAVKETVISAVTDKNTQAIIDYIWSKKYKENGEGSLDDTFRRVARAVAHVEPEGVREQWEEKFMWLLQYFLPGGRILNSHGATSKLKTTSLNCFVSPVINDDMESIFDVLKKAALTMQAGGGVGFDFSPLRPKGALVRGVGASSSGPISFLRVYDEMCKTIASSGHRRGAMMSTMRVDHPDIEEYVVAKRGDENKALTQFNLSVLVTDDFMQAVKDGKDWNLVFNGEIYKTLPARQLWDLILAQTYDYAEPGVLFIDRINKMNALNYIETITTTNPCGEQPLPPSGACNLGSINLVKFVESPFDIPTFNYDLFKEVVACSVRFLDNVLDGARLPLKEQKEEIASKRRIGLGITGLGDALWMMGLDYGSEASIGFCREVAMAMRDAAYQSSVLLAAERGAFPLFDAEKYLAGEFISKLPGQIRDGMREHGIRNSHLLSIAPTGTTSLLWGNISSGVEPIFALSVTRKIREADDKEKTVAIDDYAYLVWKSVKGNGVEPAVKTAAQITAKEHIDVMAVFQEYFDASISKTINFDPNTPFEEFKEGYLYAYKKGLKGCTVFRDSGKLGSVISQKKEKEYVKPVDLPEDRVKHSTRVMIPNEGTYEVEVTVMDNKPMEVWMHVPVEHKTGELLQAISRLISVGLRCGVDPEVLFKQIKNAQLQHGNVSSPLGFLERGFRRIIGKLGLQPTGNSAKCPICGSQLVWAESCLKCVSCEFNKCGS